MRIILPMWLKKGWISLVGWRAGHAKDPKYFLIFFFQIAAEELNIINWFDKISQIDDWH